MKLNFDEELLLALYLEYFEKEYNVNDERIINIGPKILKRHSEMQNICYITNIIVNYNKFNFTLNWVGPYSPGLQALLNELDKKEELINNYYEEYNRKREKYFKKYKDQLAYLLDKYCYEEDAFKIAFSSYVIKDILSIENGSELLAYIIYVSRNIFPGFDVDIIIEELQNKGYNIDPKIIQNIWKEITILGIRDIDAKQSFTRTKKLEIKS